MPWQLYTNEWAPWEEENLMKPDETDESVEQLQKLRKRLSEWERKLVNGYDQET